MSVFADYTDLRLHVADHIKRNDLDADIERLTRLAESNLNRQLRHPDMLLDATLTCVAGVAALPTNYLEMENVRDAMGGRWHGVEQTNVRERLLGRGAYFIQGGNINIGSADEVLTCTYFSSLPSLTTATNATNWLLQKFPDVYLYALMSEAFGFVGDAVKEDRATARMAAAIKAVKIDGERKRYGDARVTLRSAG